MRDTSRLEWIDVSRGLGVMLIVIVHAGSVYRALSPLLVPDWIRTLDLAFAPYRIPMLFTLSGLLLSRSLAKGALAYVTGKLQHIAWPFFIWTAIFLLVSDGPLAWLSIKPWLGNTPFWYLSFLGFFYCIGLVFARVRLFLIALGALAIALIAPEKPIYGEQLFVMMCYFFIGAQLGLQLDRVSRLVASRWLLLLLPVALGFSIYCITAEGNAKFSPVIVPFAVPAIGSICTIVYAAPDGWLSRSLAFAGRHSLIFYVVHLPAYMLLYDLLFALGITAPYQCISAALIVGLAAPTVLALCKERSVPVRRLFEGPSFGTSTKVKQTFSKVDRLLLRGPQVAQLRESVLH